VSGSNRRRRYDEAQDVQMPRRPRKAESGRAWPSIDEVTQRVAFFCIRELMVRTAEGGTMKHRMCKCRGGHGWPSLPLDRRCHPNPSPPNIPTLQAAIPKKPVAKNDVYGCTLQTGRKLRFIRLTRASCS